MNKHDEGRTAREQKETDQNLVDDEKKRTDTAETDDDWTYRYSDWASI